MGAVCRSWSSAASKSLKELRTRSNSSSQQIPWVMESAFCPGSRDVNCRIYSPSDKRMYKFAPFPAPPPDDHKHMLSKHFCIKQYRGIQCLGSVDEWLMVVDRTWHRPCRASGGESAKVRLYLFNPMTGEHFMLPSQSADIHVISPFISPKDSFLEKIVASSVPDTDPNNNNSCIVAAIPAGRNALLFGRPTDEKWTCQRWYHRKCGDLLFHNDGKLYAMVQEDISYLVVFDPQEVASSKNEYRGKTLFVRVPHDIPGEMEDARASLFRSTKGDIMLFWRSEVEDIYLMLRLKFGDQTCQAEWVKVSGSHDLKDEVIFVGDGGNTSSSMSKLTNSSISELLSLRGGGGNCMYYDGEEVVRQICVYNVAKETRVKYYYSSRKKAYRLLGSGDARAPDVVEPQRKQVWFTPKPVVKDYNS
ncbi:hypothetical protein D8674_015662 [Pyrus ussuriensis x Pyrus communis]|uniref:KIB1-4 beta-propeller domain-containing protein n=1 Tax=Pyrus ussuriensis x Pyrus communis TaxID=2448454 RepID=A0A5N5HCY0_9ROSA|nr:hypothetical protein D8674_015662 [Pyrus ussuriensis x Pyrus communis]